MQKRPSSVLLFLGLLTAVESVIALTVVANRPPDIPVSRGTPPADDEVVDTAAIERFMVENLARTGLAGASLAVTKNGRILYTAGYGYTSDEARVTADTPMPIASLTKSFTAAAIMLLVEQGRLTLDAPVRDYLPELELADPRSARITVRHLLNQSSGLASSALPPQPERLATSLAERIDWLRDASLVSEPGAEFNYCNDNYNVLARVIERVGDMPYAQFLEARLFHPLGLVSSRAYLTTREPMPGVADGHLLVYGALVAARTPEQVTAGAGGMVSSANDLARWLVLHGSGGNTLGGESLLSPQSVTAMHMASAPQSNYGFGWRQDSLADGTTQVHHSGVLQTFTAHQKLFPSSGASYAFVLNGGHAFRAEAVSFMAGLDAVVTGREPPTGWPFTLLGLPFGLIADNVLAVLTTLMVAMGIVGGMHARAWAARRAGRPWRTALRLAPYAALSLAVATAPWLMGVANRGRPVPWDVIFFVWPPLVVFLGAAGAAGLGILALRLAALRRQ